MVELGITPILPSFTGFVPREITELYPNAQVVDSINLNNFPTTFTNVTFLEPFDPLFGQIQSAFLEKRTDYLGNVSHFYTLDQYNENVPFSGDLDYLKEIAKGTVTSLRESDPEAIWVMQGWMFFYDQEFWSQDKVESHLSGVEKGQILILDLYTDHSPVWTWTNSYYGHDFIINSLHNFGGNQGLEGSLQVLMQNFTEAILANPSNLVGVGLAMESQEGNQIAYDIVFDQAWSKEPLDLDAYTRSYITARYGPERVSEIILYAWVDLVELVYTNDQSNNPPITNFPLRP
jgi:alpha-N-acetylglucosaminidase